MADSDKSTQKMSPGRALWSGALLLGLVSLALALYQFSQPTYAETPDAAPVPEADAATPASEATATPRIFEWIWSSGTAVLGEEPAPDSNSGPVRIYLAYVQFSVAPTPTPTDLLPEPAPAEPTPDWPPGRASLANSKLGVHVVRNGDPFIMEYVRRVRPRVMKAVDDVGWLADVKQASPNTVTIGRLNRYQNEDWPDHRDPVEAARDYVAYFLAEYRLNPAVDYWEGWNEFVPVTRARWEWYAQFEAARACEMQAQGLRAAVGGFTGGTPELNEIEYFLPALEAARRCGAIFTVHEAVSPLFGCGVFVNEANVIPGAPAIPNVAVGYMMLRYRFWYELYLKPMGLGDLPLVISELTVGGTVPGQPCNGPGGASWKGYSDWWVQQGVGPNGPQAWANLLAWYDSEIRQDPYVIGTTIFTAGANHGGDWSGEDLHDVLVPLAHYAVSVP